MRRTCKMHLPRFRLLTCYMRYLFWVQSRSAPHECSAAFGGIIPR
jgi:hypothetical protein